MSGKRWVLLGAALAFGAVVLALVVVSIAFDGGDDVDDDTAATGVRVEASADATAPFTGLTVARLSIGGDCKQLVIADEEGERAAGLRGRETAQPYDGMVFVFGGPSTATFTMSGVSAPLDIAFFDGDGQPVSRTRMRPCPERVDCPVYRAESEFVYAVETRPGGLPDGALASCG